MNFVKIGIENRNSTSQLTVKPKLEIFPENEKLKDFSKVSEFKKFNIENNNNLNKNENKDLYSTQSELNIQEQFNSECFEEKEFQIVNSFLNVENEFENDYQYDIENTEKELRKRMFFNEKFNTSIFSDFDFFDKTRDIIINSLAPFKFKNNKKNKIDLLTLQNEEINNNLILDLCIDNQIRDFSKNNNNINLFQSSQDNISFEDETDIIEKEKAIFEYENQIMSYLKLNDIERQIEICYNIDEDEPLDYNSYAFFKSNIIKEKNKDLKNKLKLILRTLNYVDPVSKIPILSNKIKNNILRAWKENYNNQMKVLLEQKKAELEEKKINKERQKLINEIYSFHSIKHRNTMNYTESTSSQLSPMKRKRKITGKQNIENFRESRRKSLMFFSNKNQISPVSKNNINTKIKFSKSLIMKNGKYKNKK